jgi:hypothetical protein
MDFLKSHLIMNAPFTMAKTELLYLKKVGAWIVMAIEKIKI